MKKQLSKITLALALVCLTAISVTAQDKDKEERSSFTPKHVLKTNVLGYLAGQYQIAYEHAINEKFSAQLSAGLLISNGSGSLNAYNYETKRGGYIVIPEARYYFAGEAPTRMYIGAFLRYRMANNDLTDKSWTSGSTGIGQDLSRERKVNSIGGGAIVGYQLVTNGGFTFDVFAGPQYKSRTTTITYDNASLNVAASDPANYDSRGDELFNSKFLNFKVDDSASMGLRFGFNIGYAF